MLDTSAAPTFVSFTPILRALSSTHYFAPLMHPISAYPPSLRIILVNGMVSLVAQLNATGDTPHLAMDINSQVHVFA